MAPVHHLRPIYIDRKVMRLSGRDFGKLYSWCTLELRNLGKLARRTGMGYPDTVFGMNQTVTQLKSRNY